MSGNDALSTALAGLEADHRRALEWFAAGENRVGPRPWRENGRSIVPGVTVPLVAQRGIHVPSKWRHALSVTVKAGSKYDDDRPFDQGDGTWVMPYRAHRGGEGSGAESRWNRGLIRCWEDRIPVGVFIPAHGSDYLCLGLALVDAYYPEHDAFELHGPISLELAADLFDFSPESLLHEPWMDDPWSTPLLEDELAMDDRRRIKATIVRRERQTEFRQNLLRLYGSCAVTEYEAPQTLEAAHISGYRGKHSHQPGNGLLLRADIHKLFDRHLLSIEPDKKIVRTGRGLFNTKYAELDGKPLRLPRDESKWPDPRRLELHFNMFSDVA